MEVTVLPVLARGIVSNRGSFGDFKGSPQCAECLRLSWILGVGVCAWGVDQGPSGKDRATTRCAGEHAMASEVHLEI